MLTTRIINAEFKKALLPDDIEAQRGSDEKKSVYIKHAEFNEIKAIALPLQLKRANILGPIIRDGGISAFFVLVAILESQGVWFDDNNKTGSCVLMSVISVLGFCRSLIHFDLYSDLNNELISSHMSNVNIMKFNQMVIKLNSEMIISPTDTVKSGISKFEEIIGQLEPEFANAQSVSAMFLKLRLFPTISQPTQAVLEYLDDKVTLDKYHKEQQMSSWRRWCCSRR